MLLKRILGFGVSALDSHFCLFRMKILAAAVLFFIALIVFSAAGLNDAVAVWIPEHRCLEKLKSGKCNTYKCMQKCSVKPGGQGRCRWNYCICTYYCHEPPK